MCLYCVLFGKKPKSFYATYRDWYLKSHGKDIEMITRMPFVPPSKTNFIYDPFCFDFDNPFEATDLGPEDIGAEVMKQLLERKTVETPSYKPDPVCPKQNSVYARQNLLFILIIYKCKFNTKLWET